MSGEPMDPKAELLRRAREGDREAFDDPSPGAVAPEREALRRCLEALGGHNERAARVVRAHYFEGSRLTEIARAMTLNLNTVKTILHRARLDLEACVQRRLREAVP